MAEEKDPIYKVTDRRKFNPDGTPREDPTSGEAAQPSHEPIAAEPAAGAGHAGNVVSPPLVAEAKSEPAASGQPAGATGHAQPSAAAAKPAAPSAAATASEQAYQQAKRATPSDQPQVSFISLVNMLAVETAMSLGLVETQGQAAPDVDLETARHMIDLLGVVQQKTRGNLTAAEDNLLDNVLADLRMQFVVRSKKQ